MRKCVRSSTATIFRGLLISDPLSNPLTFCEQSEGLVGPLESLRSLYGVFTVVLWTAFLLFGSIDQNSCAIEMLLSEHRNDFQPRAQCRPLGENIIT